MLQFFPKQKMAPLSLNPEVLPVETVVEILQNLDIESVWAMTQVSKRLRHIIEANWTVIIRPIINKEMDPIDDFLAVFGLGIPSGWAEADASDDEDATSTVEDDDDTYRSDDGLVGFGRAFDMMENDDWAHARPRATTRTTLPDIWEWDVPFLKIMEVCRTVKGWEREFHRLRFMNPIHRRALQEHEIRRLRRSLYAWWSYSGYFHEHRSPRGIFKVAWARGTDDLYCRSQILRKLSTSQLHELEDMWETVKWAVQTEICPSADLVQSLSSHSLTLDEAQRVGWSDGDENRTIHGTIMKLPPDELLYLLVNRHRFATKRSIIEFIRGKNPCIEDSVETLTDTIQRALWERERMLVSENGPRALNHRWYFPEYNFFKFHSWGGILDYRKPRWERVRDEHSRDAGMGMYDWVEDTRGPQRRFREEVEAGQLLPTNVLA
ncbi:hypothetical protein B0T25DRAFT_313497 [Lasiosphaeria hispida]|uniref:F-box domain-containing protein n=1 Tax=Lasiosphaeria hispida TaxID=260671 RepID=A0AAJ0H8X7_9PEZI|nr:hypothetical protein B0T25DRAFT_313497 [Lasiosphaeria hispida]